MSGSTTASLNVVCETFLACLDTELSCRKLHCSSWPTIFEMELCMTDVRFDGRAFALYYNRVLQVRNIARIGEINREPNEFVIHGIAHLHKLGVG